MPELNDLQHSGQERVSETAIPKTKIESLEDKKYSGPKLSDILQNFHSQEAYTVLQEQNRSHSKLQQLSTIPIAV